MTQSKKDDVNKTPDSIEQNENNMLNRLYENRKRANQVPPRLKASVMQNVSKTQAQEPWWHINLGMYAKVSALSICLALVVMVVGVQTIGSHINPLRSTNTALNVASVQIHELTPKAKPNETLIADSRELRINYDSAFSKLLAQRKSIMNLHKTTARVVQYNGELQLITSDNELLKISEEVVELLSKKQNKQITFNEGQMLALQIDDNGHIVEMLVI